MNACLASPILQTRPMLIGGKWVEAASGEVLSVENPARRQVIAHVPRGSAPDVDIAVEHASAAFPPGARSCRGTEAYSCSGSPMHSNPA
jgi:acyl-CoA reductase-like NAD-dependent aldehyde dehydrogenase